MIRPNWSGFFQDITLIAWLYKRRPFVTLLSNETSTKKRSSADWGNNDRFGYSLQSPHSIALSWLICDTHNDMTKVFPDASLPICLSAVPTPEWIVLVGDWGSGGSSRRELNLVLGDSQTSVLSRLYANCHCDLQVTRIYKISTQNGFDIYDGAPSDGMWATFTIVAVKSLIAIHENPGTYQPSSIYFYRQ